MKYFNTLPNVLTTDYSGNRIVLKNLLSRAMLMTQLSTNPLLYYTYSVQDGDTPEMVAEKYYGDQYRYWIVLYGNNSMDPQWDWPLTSKQFGDFIVSKYTNATANAFNIPANTVTSALVMSYTQSTTHHYEKVISTIDDISQTQSIKTIQIDSNTANHVVQSTTTITFGDGSTAKQSVSAKSITIYNYEDTLNESKRDIKLINSTYALSMEKQLKSVMGT